MNTGRVRQTTLRETVSLTGVGVHTGALATITVSPADAGTGYVFARSRGAGPVLDLHADISHVGATELCTTLRAGDWSVATVEHLLAALSGLEIDNAIIAVDGCEVPAMDGSSAPFVAAFDAAGVVTLDERRAYIRILRPIRVEQGASFAEIRPYPGRRFEIDLDYDNPVIGKQRLAVDLTPGLFRGDIAPARTFGFLEEVEMLRARGLARGGSLDNALVIGNGAVLNPGGLRFADEFVRHKMLDAIGDLALAGAPILGCYHSYRGGHRLNASVVEAFLAAPGAWEWADGGRKRPIQAPELVPELLEPQLT